MGRPVLLRHVSQALKNVEIRGLSIHQVLDGESETVVEASIGFALPKTRDFWLSVCAVFGTSSRLIRSMRLYFDATLLRHLGLLPTAKEEDWSRPMHRVVTSSPSPVSEELEVIREYFDACNAQDALRIMRWHRRDARSVFCDWPQGMLEGAEAIARFWAKVLESRPDCRWVVDHFVGSGRDVAVEWSLSATYPELGPIWTSGCDVFKVTDGLIVSVRQYWDGSVARVGRQVDPREWTAPMMWP